jgi:hypothetical protein
MMEKLVFIENYIDTAERLMEVITTEMLADGAIEPWDYEIFHDDLEDVASLLRQKLEHRFRKYQLSPIGLASLLLCAAQIVIEDVHVICLEQMQED